MTQRRKAVKFLAFLFFFIIYNILTYIGLAGLSTVACAKWYAYPVGGTAGAFARAKRYFTSTRAFGQRWGSS